MSIIAFINELNKRLASKIVNNPTYLFNVYKCTQFNWSMKSAFDSMIRHARWSNWCFSGDTIIMPHVLFRMIFQFSEEKTTFVFAVHKTGTDDKAINVFLSRSRKPYARTVQNVFITYIMQWRELNELISMKKLAFPMRTFTLNHDFWVKDFKFIKQFCDIKSK